MVSGVSGPSGTQEFTQSGTFTVPPGVTRVLVEIRSEANGERGAVALSLSPVETQSCPHGGACIRAVLNVAPGTTYTITVGGF